MFIEIVSFENVSWVSTRIRKTIVKLRNRTVYNIYLYNYRTNFVDKVKARLVIKATSKKETQLNVKQN